MNYLEEEREKYLVAGVDTYKEGWNIIKWNKEKKDKQIKLNS